MLLQFYWLRELVGAPCNAHAISPCATSCKQSNWLFGLPSLKLGFSFNRLGSKLSIFSINDPLWKLLDIDLEGPLVKEEIQEEVSISKKEILTVSSPVKEPSVTLFGRARVGLGNSIFGYEDLVEPPNGNDDIDVGSDGDVPVGQYDGSMSNTLTKGIRKRATAYSPTGSSNGVSENVRKLYRSMHLPVPKPLPSLVDLLNDRKRAKRRFML